MKVLIYTLKVAFVLYVTFALIGAFCFLDISPLNPAEWHSFVRLCFGVFVFVFVSLAALDGKLK